MPDLTRPGASLHYEISGDGPPLLLIAGFMSDGASWAPLLPLLEPHFTLIRPDNRTTGQTTPSTGPVSLDYWTDDILALMDHLNLPFAALLGHSLGGMISWALACKAPERVTTLLMMGSAPLPSPRNAELFDTLLTIRASDAPPGTWLRVLFPWLFPTAMFGTPGFVTDAVAQSLAYPHAQSAEAMALQMQAISEMPPDTFAAPPPVLTRALLAEDDLLVPLIPAKAALQGIPCDTINDAGHSIHWSHPEDVVKWVRANLP